MRRLLAVVLAAGLLALGCDVYEQFTLTAPAGTGGGVQTMEDGTGFPPPNK